MLIEVFDVEMEYMKQPLRRLVFFKAQFRGRIKEQNWKVNTIQRRSA